MNEFMKSHRSAARPQLLWKSWKRIAAELGRARRIALFADFDGTLVRIKQDPDRTRLTSRVRRLLGEIADKGALVGIVSGRELNDVKKRVGLRHIWYAGAHGYFLRDASNRSYSLAAPKHVRRIRAAGEFLERRLKAMPGVRLEPKGATIAVHYRGAPKRSEEMARRAVAEALKEDPSLCLLPGKKVLELLPDSQTDKLKAIRFILHREQKQHHGARRVIFIGDDVADERVFKNLRGISIAVGKRQRTAARYYVYSPAGVRRFLGRLSEKLR